MKRYRDLPEVQAFAGEVIAGPDLKLALLVARALGQEDTARQLEARMEGLQGGLALADDDDVGALSDAEERSEP